MKKILLTVALIICFSLNAAYSANAVDLTLHNAPAQVYFSPRGGCTDAIVDKIDQAKSEVLVQAYSFTSAPIAKALLKAHKRGVKVEVILDRSQRTERYSSAKFFTNQGIPTFIDDRHVIAHNKVMIIDREIVITGSFNLTKAADGTILADVEKKKFYHANKHFPETLGYSFEEIKRLSVLWG